MQSDSFNLDETLVQFSPYDSFSHRDAMNGNIVFGGVGSGKSSGSGATFLRSYMATGYGMLCLTVKPEETQELEAIANEQGRGSDVIKISPDSGYSHDPFIAEDLREIGAETQTVVKLYSRLVEIANGAQSSNESYWVNAQQTMLTSAVIALKSANEPVSVENIYRLIISAPTSQNVLTSSTFQESSYCFSVLTKASENAERQTDNVNKPLHLRDFDFAQMYWLEDFPKLAEKTRSIIVSTLTSTASLFLTGSLRTVFTEDKTRIPCPPDLARQGKIIIVDMSVKVYEDVGVMANSLYKLLFQKAMERIPLKVSGVPVALYADECQHFINDYDNLFLQTSRSSGVSVFLLTQSINNLITKYGEQGEPKAYNLLGLIGNKIAHRNTCVKTNSYFAELIGQDWDYQSSSSVNMGEDDENKMSSSISEQRRYIVEPIRFTELPSGGLKNDLTVGAIIHNGNEWNDEQKFLHCYFKQQ